MLIKNTTTAKQMLHNMKEKVIKYGAGASNWSLLYTSLLGDFYEIAIVGKNAKQLLKEINKKYIPNKLIVGSINESSLPLLQYKHNKNETTIYVCIDGTCLLPVTESEKAFQQINTTLK